VLPGVGSVWVVCPATGPWPWRSSCPPVCAVG
jgi:hypothetical protein